MAETATTSRAARRRPAWYKETAVFQQPSLRKAIWQLANTFIPYLALWALMIYTVRAGYSYWLTLIMIVIGAGLQVRIFIFFHDCGHGSFFASRRANAIVGTICGILTLTPYEDWRHAHAIHHASVSNLDRRGTGDVWTMTVREYTAAPWWRKVAYRVFRFPPVTFLIGPSLIFMLLSRFPSKGARRKDVISVLLVDLAIVVALLVAHWTIGLRTFLVIYLPMVAISATAGVWLFYVQHQFDGTYWAEKGAWDSTRAALEGSSFYKLPAVLQWFTGNIGYHHVHHVRARIPNYHLQRCHEAIPAIRAVRPLGLLESLQCAWLDLWDEEQHKLISFRTLRRAAVET
jgi:omega-6 fatty acid desaturase (delta-12 desaturase)